MSNPELTRRGFLGMTGAAALGSSIAGAEPGAPQGPAAERSPAGRSRSNLILFVADELRADALACYGNP